MTTTALIMLSAVLTIILWFIIEKILKNSSTNKSSTQNTISTSAIPITSKESKPRFLKVLGLLTLLIMLVMIIYPLINRHCSSNSGKGSNQAPTYAYVPAQTVPVQTSRTFSFDQSREVHVYLKAGWKTYPKGGNITIITPNGIHLHDQPGVNNDFGFQPEGNYTIIAEQNTIGVEIYNYW